MIVLEFDALVHVDVAVATGLWELVGSHRAVSEGSNII